MDWNFVFEWLWYRWNNPQLLIRSNCCWLYFCWCRQWHQPAYCWLICIFPSATFFLVERTKVLRSTFLLSFLFTFCPYPCFLFFLNLKRNPFLKTFISSSSHFFSKPYNIKHKEAPAENEDGDNGGEDGGKGQRTLNRMWGRWREGDSNGFWGYVKGA